MSNLSLYGTYGARYDFNKAKRQEKFANNFGTSVALAGAGLTAYGVNALAKHNPLITGKLYKGIDKYTAIGLDKSIQYGKQFINFINKNQYVKIATDKLGEWFMKGTKKVGKTETGKKFLTKALDNFEKFCGLSSVKRGRAILLTAGAALLTGTIAHIIRNHDRNDGAIEQKYNDINKLSQIL